MVKSLSVDLALTDYSDFGVCLLEGSDPLVTGVEFLSPQALGLCGSPTPEGCADALARFCASNEIDVLLLDGPQGWKDPGNGLEHSRVCERKLNCPAKTGTVGNVKPATYRGFVEFSIGIFTRLAARCGMTLLTRDVARPNQGTLLVETFPNAAWRSLGMQSLPSKNRCSWERLQDQLRLLAERVCLAVSIVRSHDDLQALIAGLAGPAIACKHGELYRLAGVNPIPTAEGYVLEGLIANPVNVYG